MNDLAKDWETTEFVLEILEALLQKIVDLGDAVEMVRLQNHLSMWTIPRNEDLAKPMMCLKRGQRLLILFFVLWLVVPYLW